MKNTEKIHRITKSERYALEKQKEKQKILKDNITEEDADEYVVLEKLKGVYSTIVANDIKKRLEEKITRTEKKDVKKLYNIRLNESDRNIIASTFQKADGINFTEGVRLAGLFVAELYKQNKIIITKEGIKLI